MMESAARGLVVLALMAWAPAWAGQAPAPPGDPGRLPSSVAAESGPEDLDTIRLQLDGVLADAGFDRAGRFSANASDGTVTYDNGQLAVTGGVRDGRLFLDIKPSGDAATLATAPTGATVPSIDFVITPGAQPSTRDWTGVSSGGAVEPLNLAAFDRAFQAVNGGAPGGERLDTVQVVMVSARHVRRASRTGHGSSPPMVLRRAPISAAMRTALPAATPAASARVFITSRGRLGADALELHVEGSIESPDLTLDGIVLEPLKRAALPPSPRDVRRRAGGRAGAAMLDAYCLEYLRLPPTAGTGFRVADRDLQRRFAPMRRILQASRRLEDAGRLHPDSDPVGYGHAIRQWALWTHEQGFDREGFARAFVKQTRDNLEKSGRKWTGETEKVLLAAVPNRWRDITAVLREAGVSELVRPR
jgi:hypothetical protein